MNAITTLEPVTESGWYERTDGTVGRYVWVGGYVRLAQLAKDWKDAADKDQWRNRSGEQP